MNRAAPIASASAFLFAGIIISFGCAGNGSQAGLSATGGATGGGNTGGTTIGGTTGGTTGTTTGGTTGGAGGIVAYNEIVGQAGKNASAAFKYTVDKDKDASWLIGKTLVVDFPALSAEDKANIGVTYYKALDSSYGNGDDAEYVVLYNRRGPISVSGPVRVTYTLMDDGAVVTEKSTTIRIEADTANNPYFYMLATSEITPNGVGEYGGNLTIRAKARPGGSGASAGDVFEIKVRTIPGTAMHDRFYANDSNTTTWNGTDPEIELDKTMLKHLSTPNVPVGYYPIEIDLCRNGTVVSTIEASIYIRPLYVF